MSDNDDEGPRPQQELRTQMVLRLHADNLPRYGIRMALPDTYAVVTSVLSGRVSTGNSGVSGPFVANDADESSSSLGKDRVFRKTEWGRTEVVHKSSRPQWTTTFPLTYEYGSECYFFVRIFRAARSSESRHNNKNSGRQEQPLAEVGKEGEPEGESLGDAVFEIGDILGSRNHTKIKRLPKGGVIFCRMEPVQETNQNRIFRFQFAANNLLVTRKGLASLSPFSNAPDTIVQISKRHPSASQQAWIAVYRSRSVENSLAPTWDVGQIDLESVCNGDLDRPLRLAVLAHRKMAQDVLLGECETTLRVILNTQRDTHPTNTEEEISRHGFPLQRNMSKPKPVGRLQIRLAQVMDTTSMDQNFVDPSFPSVDDTIQQEEEYSSDPYTINIGALPTPMAAPATFQDYIDSGWELEFNVAIDFTSSNGDPRIPGTLHDQNPITLNDYEETMVSIGNAVSPYTHAGSLGTRVWGFGCKFDGALRHIFQCGPDSQVFGVDGILRAYKSVFESDLTMSGPTSFDQVIQAAAVQAQRMQQTKLLRYSVLLVVTDGICQDVVDTKRKLAVYSTVPLSILFVGVGRADFGAMHDLVSNPSSAPRANATFVEFRQHQHDPTSLGRSALQNLPGQLVPYMLQNNILPDGKDKK